MILLCIAFLIGFLIPFISSRFGKILPADPGLVLLHLWHRPHFPKVNDDARIRQLKQKWKNLIGVSLFWGCFLVLGFWASLTFLPQNMGPWGCVFLSMIGFCIVVDWQYNLLPDFFTIPLLMLGFWMVAFVPNLNLLDGVIGGTFGYLLSAVSVWVMGLFRRTELGFGDIKMMTALGVWLGMYGLNYALILSFFFFSIQTLIQGRRSGPYGPALGVSAIITFFFIYAV